MSVIMPSVIIEMSAQWATSMHSVCLLQTGAVLHVTLPANKICMSPQNSPATQCFHLTLLLDLATFQTVFRTWRRETKLATFSWRVLLVLVCNIDSMVCECEVFLSCSHRLPSLSCVEWQTRGAAESYDLRACAQRDGEKKLERLATSHVVLR